jgi:hypothetical protein
MLWNRYGKREEDMEKFQKGIMIIKTTFMNTNLKNAEIKTRN